MKIETKRLILRPPRKSDWKDILEGARDLDVSKELSDVPHPYKKKDAEWFIDDVIKKWEKKEKKNYTFFIELKSEKKVIGSTNLYSINQQDRGAKTGSWINKKYWRKGYILEAKIPILDFAFNKLNLIKIETEAFVKNKASNNMSKKLGFKKEGTKRKSCIPKATGEILDSNIYGILKEEWEKSRPKLIKKMNEKLKNDK